MSFHWLNELLFIANFALSLDTRIVKVSKRSIRDSRYFIRMQMFVEILYAFQISVILEVRMASCKAFFSYIIQGRTNDQFVFFTEYFSFNGITRILRDIIH